jgi:2-polyprenyl-3-methyl-5-hydroxy-6-metoxy-1,4-benzoquinol methylase
MKKMMINNFEINIECLSEETKNLVHLLASDEWPEAAPSYLICDDSETDKKERAESIIDYVDESLKEKKFLDFGCGEGHVAATANNSAILSVGYDKKKTGNLTWEHESPLLTTDIEKVRDFAPYDHVLIYDVLDHSEDPTQILTTLRSLCSEDSKVYVRCHSWMSRHGSHLYRQVNKAYIHLVFTQQELQQMGLIIEPTLQYLAPILTQKKWFENAGFEVTSECVVECAVESFFRRAEIEKRLPKINGSFPEWQMSQAFNDYIIRKK